MALGLAAVGGHKDWLVQGEVMEDLQFDYVRVPEELEVLDLPADLAHNVQTPDLLSVQDLHGNLMLRQLMLANCEAKKRKTR